MSLRYLLLLTGVQTQWQARARHGLKSANGLTYKYTAVAMYVLYESLSFDSVCRAFPCIIKQGA
jgi:hypothetical protein